MHDFKTTQWSVVLSARRESDVAHDTDWREALESLCRQYWYPLYAYLRRKGYRPEDAQDLTQGFFASLIEKDYLQAVDPQRGRFRWFMMDAIGKFASKWQAAEKAQKRGGDRKILSIDFDTGEARYAREPVDAWTPERLFDREWALRLLTQALDLLRDDFKQQGKLRHFDMLKAYLSADSRPPSYAQTAGELGLSLTAAKVAIHRVRERYRETIRRLVADTLDPSESLDDEIDQLLAAL